LQGLEHLVNRVLHSHLCLGLWTRIIADLHAQVLPPAALSPELKIMKHDLVFAPEMIE